MTDTAKRLFGRVDSMYRYLVMSYQLGVVSKAIDSLDRSERRQLVELTDRKTQATLAELSRSAAESFSRVRSDNAQVRLHAIAQWLGSAFLETRDTTDGDFQEIHRRVARTLRQVRDSLPRPATRAAAA